jgi:hypothetical protein
MKMKAIREWWRRIGEFLKRYAALADQDPWDVFDRRLRRVEKAVGLRPPAGKGEAGGTS